MYGPIDNKAPCRGLAWSRCAQMRGLRPTATGRATPQVRPARSGRPDSGHRQAPCAGEEAIPFQPTQRDCRSLHTSPQALRSDSSQNRLDTGRVTQEPGQDNGFSADVISCGQVLHHCGRLDNNLRLTKHRSTGQQTPGQRTPSLQFDTLHLAIFRQTDLRVHQDKPAPPD
jgi:hypothetical protein